MLHRTLVLYYVNRVLGKEHLLYIFAIFGPLSGSTFAAAPASASELTDCEPEGEPQMVLWNFFSFIVCGGGIYDVCHFRVGRWYSLYLV